MLGYRIEYAQPYIMIQSVPLEQRQDDVRCATHKAEEDHHKDLSSYTSQKRQNSTNPKVLKVGAAIHDDIRGLQKHQDFKPAAFVDLQKIVCEWGIRDKSVKKMAAIIMGIRISKTQQLSNWEADTLSESQCRYAATDAWVCREMYLRLMASEKNPLKEETL